MNQANKNLNTFTLSGLIIGPILGSGIILLPPLLYNMIGNYSLIIWAVILTLGFIFALIFSKLAIIYPGDGGVSLATKEALGKKYQLLTSFYLISAVFFGPVAVLLIAAQFIKPFFPNESIVNLGFYIYIITYILLLLKIDFIGKLMLFVNSAITLIFFISSINILLNTTNFTFVIPSLELSQIGYSFILAFWAIVGWEVIGNYSNESFKLIWLIDSLFKSYSNIVISTISLVLCIGTLILFVGGVARLISSLKLTTYTSKHLSNKTPIGALNLLSMIYILTLILVYFEILTLDNLVAFADGFFIANAIIGLITAIVLFKKVA